MQKITLTTTILSTTLFFSLTAHAQSPGQDAYIRTLEAKIERLERVVNKVVETQEAQPSVSLKPGLRVHTADKAYSFGVDGFVQVDAGWNDTSNNDMADSTNIQRARLGVKGTFASDWKYRFLTEFADKDFHVIDAFASYNGVKNLSLSVGQQREPFGLENMTPAKYWTSNERASLTTFAPKRSIGAAASYYYGDGTISAGVFGENMYQRRVDDEGYGVSARGTYFHESDEIGLVHLGLSARWREPDDETGSIRFKDKGHATFNPVFVDTGNIQNVAYATTFNPEIAWIYGPFSLQGEYTHTHVARDGGQDLNFSGYYGEASYFLTGESRNYKKKKGIFGKVKPDAAFDLDSGEYGAWQVSYRFDHIDLNDQDIAGGKMDGHTVGLNWFPNDATRVSANLIYNETDHHAKLPDEEATIFMLRTQFEF